MENYIVFNQRDFIARVRGVIKDIFNKEDIQESRPIDIDVSTRLTRCNGKFTYKSRCGTPVRLRFSSHMLDGRYTLEHVDAIILHEVLHYLANRLGYYNEGHGYNFKALCRKHKCRIDGAFSEPHYSNQHGEKTASYASMTEKYTCTCDECKKSWGKGRASNVTKYPYRYKSGCCSATITVKQNY